MLHVKNDIFKKLTLGHIWIFLTERCNLHCDYCFFGYRNEKRTLPFNALSVLLARLPCERRYDFVISGGEPLLCWRLTRLVIERIRKIFPDSSLTLQTNALLLTEERVIILKEKAVAVEPGIDGDFLSNYRHRKGFTNAKFDKFLHNLGLIVKHKLKMNPTMTVHPQETRYMFKNFLRLVSLGLTSIDIHPAFLARWHSQAAREFVRQYRKIIQHEQGAGAYLVCKSYSMPTNLMLDLVIQPDGFVLPNWTYLAFPYGARENFFIMRLSKNGLFFARENFSSYLRGIRASLGQHKTYREFSNANASLILKNFKDAQLKRSFMVYKRLCETIQDIDRKFLREEDVHNAYSIR